VNGGQALSLLRAGNVPAFPASGPAYVFTAQHNPGSSQANLFAPAVLGHLIYSLGRARELRELLL